MAKSKNFTINRDVNDPTKVMMTDLKIGDVFERQGSIHMRVRTCQYPATPGKIAVCNLNTGSVWEIDESEVNEVVSNCTINYSVVNHEH